MTHRPGILIRWFHRCPECRQWFGLKMLKTSRNISGVHRDYQFVYGGDGDYKGLLVAEDISAIVFPRLETIADQLLEYCKLDTLAMVRIVDALLQRVSYG